jgi:hypothetical protein
VLVVLVVGLVLGVAERLLFGSGTGMKNKQIYRAGLEECYASPIQQQTKWWKLGVYSYN